MALCALAKLMTLRYLKLAGKWYWMQVVCAKSKIYAIKPKKTKFPFAEVFLGIASLLLGAFLGALIAKVPYELCFASVLSYNICPVGGIGCGVAYFFCRHNESADVVQLATQVDECVSDSDGVENEE